MAANRLDNERRRLERRIRDLSSLRESCLDQAREDRRKVSQFLREAKSPPRAADSYRHEQDMQSRAREAERAADSADREASRLRNEIDGIRRELDSLR